MPLSERAQEPVSATEPLCAHGQRQPPNRIFSVSPVPARTNHHQQQPHQQQYHQQYHQQGDPGRLKLIVSGYAVLLLSLVQQSPDGLP